MRLQEIYGEDVKRVDEIYNELVGEDKSTPNCEITYEKLNNSYISYKFSFNKQVKNFDTKDIKLYNVKKQETSFGSNITLSIIREYTVNVEQGKTYIVMFDYESTGNENFEFGLYSETVENLPTKTLTATTQKKHEEHKLKVNSKEEIFKIAIINKQSINNVEISNFEILEIENDNVQKGAFVKINESTYTLVAEYNKDLRYVIIIDKETLTDLNENKNLEIVKGI